MTTQSTAQRTAVVFPGQGAQSVGMGRDAYESSARARALFDRADEVLGFALARLCFDGPAAELERTDIQQPAIFVASAALWATLEEAGVGIGRFCAAAGLSLGEYTALYAAGAMVFEDALRLVHRRGVLMQQAATALPSGMVSLLGADSETAGRLCAELREDDVLVPANFNAPGQVVVSGSRAACQRVVDEAERFGCRAVALAVAGAFHSPLMAPAAEALSGALADIAVSVPTVPVLSNVSGAPHAEPASIRDLLRQQLTAPVRWQACVERMIRDGAIRFVEVGPGRVLTGLLRKIDRGMNALTVNTAVAARDAATALDG
jgi:[acyl-carrier-protein] S-malonyltransferase